MQRCLRLALMLLAVGCVDLTHPPQFGNPEDALAPADVGRDQPAPLDLADAAPEMDGESLDADLGPESGDDAHIDAPADVSSDAPLLLNGTSCLAGTDCQSGICSDGVCCNSTCEIPCHACNVAGLAGTCTPIAAGEDPANDCSAEPPETCGRDGACDGNGGCRRHSAGTVCAAGSCTDARERAASTCDGDGICQPGTTKSCAPNVCKDGACGATCAGPADCQAGFFCDTTTCRAKLTSGATCTAAVQCSSGFCVDGVCCGTACGQTCSACNLPGSLGTCTAIAIGQDPASECPAEAAATCGRAGGCNGAGACRLHAAGVACAAATCSGGSATGAGQCNGTGTCVTPAPQSCGTFLCNGSTCGTSCATSNQCAAGAVCVGTSCVACTPETDVAFCTRLAKSCGQVTAIDNCGSARTVASCGTCTAPQTCGGGGTANVCGGGSPCAAAYAQSNCTGYIVGSKVASGGHNWTCSSGNCANCATNANCAPGGSGCPWGVVWTDNGACN